MATTRIERDTMGEMTLPAEAFYGASTQRAVENFPVSGQPLPPAFIHALGLVKVAAARVNRGLGLLPAETADAIEAAAQAVADGAYDAEFPIDVFQTGSGTSTNMNANEVIATVASRALGRKVHPNDDVNLGQSSNDVIPTVLHVAAAMQIERHLLPALRHLQETLTAKAVEFDEVVKIGRTHLMDAVPIRLGQEFSGYARQVELAGARVEAALPGLRELAIGGTAVGTGLNTHAEFGARMARALSAMAGTEFTETVNHFEAQGAQDAYVFAAGALTSVAASLMKIANDVRLLGSGPQAGLGELLLPAIQPGSSIMPGKVNPVIAEAVIQVGAQVTGNGTAVVIGGQWGQLDLNTMLPMMARNLLESIRLLANVSRLFADKCLAGTTANVERAEGYVEGSISMATALNPHIGYDRAAQIAKKSYASGRTVREIAYEDSGLSREQVDEALHPHRQTVAGTGAGHAAGD
ncbi:MAG TPA: class II fumarate hydratase [Thermomicrobiales bacterium]|nr:class II fumarate hydratase [Thermomicrobiales bacterium]